MPSNIAVRITVDGTKYLFSQEQLDLLKKGKARVKENDPYHFRKRVFGFLKSGLFYESEGGYVHRSTKGQAILQALKDRAKKQSKKTKKTRKEK